MSEQIKIGTKVRTAAVLTGMGWGEEATRRRRPSAGGEVVGILKVWGEPAFSVRHEDGESLPYGVTELTPVPDEKTAPTTPIGRLRATICDVTGASLFVDQWEKIDAGLREVETQIAGLRASVDPPVDFSEWGEPRSLTEGALARMYVTPDAWDDLESEQRSRTRAAIRWLVEMVSTETTAAAREVNRQDVEALRAEIERLTDVNGVKVEAIDRVLAKHRAAVGAVGPMPVEKADPWPKVLERIEAVHDLLTDIAKPDPAAEGRELDTPLLDVLRAARSEFQASGERLDVNALLADLDGKDERQAVRQAWDGWDGEDPQAGGRGLSAEEAIQRYGKPARPRVGPWVRDVDRSVFDERGHVVASLWTCEAGFRWRANKAFGAPVIGTERTKKGAEAAASAVLATWADVEGRQEAVEAPWGPRQHARGAKAAPEHQREPISSADSPIRERHVGPPLSLVVAFGSEGAPVILEAAGPWEGIEERPSPPARGLWRWVGRAVRHEAGDVGGWLFEGTWTLIPVSAVPS